MKAVTIREAKARLNELIEAAGRGEQVVLMRGSKHVATIVPISAEDLELSPRLTDAQAERLWAQLAQERRARRTVVVGSAAAAVRRLGGGRARRSPSRPARPRSAG